MKNWYAFLGCLVLSCSIWLVMNMSRNNTALVSVTVQAYSNLEGRSYAASEPVEIPARCRASGFQLMALSASDDIAGVTFKAEDLRHVDGDVFSVDAATLMRYVQDIFGKGVSVESFAEPAVSFRFLSEDYRKLPVRPVTYQTFRSQYTASGPISLSIDSVLVYGTPERLGELDRIETELLSLKDLHRSAHGFVNLVVPPGVRLSEKEVGYSLNVVRYVELVSKVRVNTRNVPAGTDFIVFPSTADVVWKCVYPVRSSPVDVASFYVDYHDFEGSLNGKCIIRTSDVPDGVIGYTVTPQVCDCVEKASEK